MTISLRTSLNTGLNSGLRQSISGGAGARSFTGSTLDLDFAGAKSLKNQIGSKDIVSFTRASSGTYVGGDGLIKTTPVNLLIRSEEFNSVAWANIGLGTGSSAVVTLNSAIAPDGTQTASRLQCALNGGTGSASNQSLIAQTYASSGDQTISIYVKSNTGSNQTIYFANTQTSGDTITVTPEWQRFEFSFSTPYVLAIGLRGRAGGGIDDTADVLIWGAQAEQGTTATEYIPTTSTISGAPRFDHDPATGESLGLLIEEARTNLIPYSNMGSGFNVSGVSNTFAANEINPEGTTGCRKIQATTETNKPRQTQFNATASSNFTVSVFVKFDNWRYVRVGFGSASHSVMALFDIDPSVTGNRLLLQGGNGTHSNIDAEYENYPNGWIRIWVSGTTAGTAGPHVGLHPNATTAITENWDADGTESVFAHGMQYEDNVTFPTSYIPTSGSSVTRAADIAEITGTNFSSFYNQGEGTIFSDCKGDGRKAYEFSNGTSAMRIGHNIDITASGVFVFISNSFTGLFENTSAGSRVKTAVAIKSGDYRAASNGIFGPSKTTASTPILTQVGLGGKSSDRGGDEQLNGHIKRFAYFPTRLPDATLQSITS